jgi:hypothetical protein
MPAYSHSHSPPILLFDFIFGLLFHPQFQKVVTFEDGFSEDCTCVSKGASKYFIGVEGEVARSSEESIE